jgi:hypothetical protein
MHIVERSVKFLKSKHPHNRIKVLANKRSIHKGRSAREDEEQARMKGHIRVNVLWIKKA